VHRIANEGVERRGFLAVLGALAGFTAVKPGRRQETPVASSEWDMSWLNGLTGRHKQVFDMSDMETLRVVRNWLDAHQEVYGLAYPDLNTVVGIGGEAFPINASDALYQKYPIGDLWKVTDPESGKPAERSIFLQGGKTPREQGSRVHALQARGTIFWQCNNALHGVAGRIGDAVKRPEPEVYESLKAGLNAGVILVPAHTMLIGLCQEHGCAYEAL
jgi:hypothetical protein